MASLLEQYSSAQEEAALNDISYSRKQLNQDIITLGEWIDDQEHLPPSKKNENTKFLSAFLTGTKGSLQTAKRKIDNYYSLRSTTQILEDRDPLCTPIKNTFGHFFVATLPKPLPDGARLSILRLDGCDPDDYDFMGTIRRIVQLSELRMRLENGISAGEYFCLDGRGYTASHLLRVNPTVVREALAYIQDYVTAVKAVFEAHTAVSRQDDLVNVIDVNLVDHYPLKFMGKTDAVPARIKLIMFINCPSFVEVAVNKLVKPFLKKKLADRVVVTQDGAAFLQEKFPNAVLPKDYGGDLPDLETLSNDWQKTCEQKRNWYLSDLSEKIVEEKRPKDSEINSENPYFGVQGTLKQLVID